MESSTIYFHSFTKSGLTSFLYFLGYQNFFKEIDGLVFKRGEEVENSWRKKKILIKVGEGKNKINSKKDISTHQRKKIERIKHIPKVN